MNRHGITSSRVNREMVRCEDNKSLVRAAEVVISTVSKSTGIEFECAKGDLFNFSSMLSMTDISEK